MTKCVLLKKFSLKVFDFKGFNLKKLGVATLVAMAMNGIIAPITALPASAAIAVDFSKLVEQVSSGVVRVNITKKVSDEELAKIQTAEVLRQYLGDKVDIPAIPAIEYAHGTGFFVSKDGYILTNHHVVEGADTITVTLSDRTELDAKLIGSDESSDVAVLKITGDSFPVLPLATEDTLKVGEPVLAIGSPFGFDYSASAGIVSAKSRSFGREASVPFIQTDVALNPGNSGGPLFNQKGEVVGINSRIFSKTGGYMGLSFSIPMDVALDIYEQIRTTGKVTRVYLGISVQDVDRNLAQAYGLDKPQGAVLTRVSPTAPAGMAGLKTGDLVLSFNKTPIVRASDLLTIIGKARPNQDFVVGYLRDGKVYEAHGKFEQMPSEETTRLDKVKLGVRLKALSAGEAGMLGLSGGVVLTAVEPLGLASKSGLQAGDVIVRLNQTPIMSVADFSTAVDGLPKQGVVTLYLMRQGEPAIIGLRIE